MAYGALQTELINKNDHTIKTRVHNGFNLGTYSDIDVTYVTSGNGIGEIETVTYSNNGTVIATLTLAYNADDKLISVTKS
jgi:phenolic acid decarboxylase